MMESSKYFRISITESCNLNCFYCHNEGNDKFCSNHLTIDDIAYVTNIASGQGFKKVKLTGGEPTLFKQLPELIKLIKKIEIDDLSIITNGTNLEKSVAKLKNAGLDRINVTLNTIDCEKYESITRSSYKMLEKTIRGIDLAIENGFSDMKINFVYIGVDSDNDLYDLIDFVSKRNIVLVILPVIYNNLDYVSLDKLYAKIKSFGIISEFTYYDEEGIEKKLIKLLSGAKIILRVDELGNKKPYKFCQECTDIHLCKEGIFPLRLTVNGDLLLCLASDRRISIYNAIKSKNEKQIIEALSSIRGWIVETM